MDHDNYDMEMTPENMQRMKKTLVHLYCDQYDKKVVSIKINKKGEHEERYRSPQEL